LGFVPESIDLGVRDDTLVVSSKSEFAVLTTQGEVLARGPGPCAIDPSRRFAIAWVEKVLTLYRLSPFQRVRAWSEEVGQPQAIFIAEDGRRFVSVDPEGQQKVWELDEDSRVFERQLLLTPGSSYHDLMESYEAFMVLFSQAQRLFQKKQDYLAYRSVLNARSEPGFYQSEDALELQWQLCKRLRRVSLEALWERLYSVNIVSGSLSYDQQTLLLAQQDCWIVREFGKRGGGAIRLTLKSKSPILSARYVTAKTGESVVVLVHQNGMASCLRSESGSGICEEDLGLGPLAKAFGFDDSILLISESCDLAFFHPHRFEVTSSMRLDPGSFRAAFPLLRNRALVVFEGQGPALVNLKKESACMGLPIDLVDLPGEVSFAGETELHGLFLAGFSEGTFVIADGMTGKVVLTTKHSDDAITGACLNVPMGLGVTADRAGGLTLFDLNSGEVLEHHKVHTDAIESVRLTSNGRYLLTRSTMGESRFWELSWALDENRGPYRVEWLSTGPLVNVRKLFRSVHQRLGLG